jgi:hypothetical protein
VGESFSTDLPLANAVQTKLASLNDSYVAQICDPWLGYWSAQENATVFTYVRGGERPAATEVAVYAGCPQAFDATVPESDQAWLAVRADGRTVPMKLKLDVITDGLEPGEYKTTLKVTVREAFYSTLEIPVVLRVSDPPPPVVE